MIHKFEADGSQPGGAALQGKGYGIRGTDFWGKKTCTWEMACI